MERPTVKKYSKHSSIGLTNDENFIRNPPAVINEFYRPILKNCNFSANQYIFYVSIFYESKGTYLRVWALVKKQPF